MKKILFIMALGFSIATNAQVKTSIEVQEPVVKTTITKPSIKIAQPKVEVVKPKIVQPTASSIKVKNRNNASERGRIQSAKGKGKRKTQLNKLDAKDDKWKKSNSKKKRIYKTKD